MNKIIGIIIAISLTTLISPFTVFSQTETENEIDLNGTISDLAIKNADYHKRLAEIEEAKGNQSGADIHWGLAGMTIEEEMSFMDRVLTNQEKNKIEKSGFGNCIFINNSIDPLKCLN
jgi:hypothetical protein